MRRPARSIRKAGRRPCVICASYQIPLHEPLTGQRGARLLRCPVQPNEEAMIFGLLCEPVSGTYSYVLASRRGGEALIIDPVLEKVDRYLRLMEELDLKLVKAVDTHLHADHITGLGALRDRTHCITIMGEQSKVDVVGMRIGDGDRLGIDCLSLDVLYPPGHTDDSYSLLFG